jgi:hypothetical protein
MSNLVGIVGGGASGMMAAITAARHGAEVTLFEGNERLGKKILSTGNGKCNLGNEKLDLDEYFTQYPDRLKHCLERFDTEDTITFFQGIGLLVKSRNGYLYPACEQAAAVLDVLRYEVAELNVHVITGKKITGIEAGGKKGRIRVTGDGEAFWFDRVILACGGRAAPQTGSDGSGYELAAQLGHTINPVVPALVQLKCREDSFKAVSGVRSDARLSVQWKGRCVAQERGELLLTDYGISGIPVFQLSRTVNYLLTSEEGLIRKEKVGGRDSASGKNKLRTGGEVEMVIDFLPDYAQEEYERFCAGRSLLQGRRTVEEFFTGILNKKLMILFIKMAGLRPSERIGEADKGKIDQVYGFCRRWQIHVTGSNSFDHAQVCAGGVPLNEVTDDLESVYVPGVFFAGELLDVDGKCGGYNLQWAWCSGYLAGIAASNGKRA